MRKFNKDGQIDLFELLELIISNYKYILLSFSFAFVFWLIYYFSFDQKFEVSIPIQESKQVKFKFSKSDRFFLQDNDYTEKLFLDNFLNLYLDYESYVNNPSFSREILEANYDNISITKKNSKFSEQLDGYQISYETTSPYLVKKIISSSIKNTNKNLIKLLLNSTQSNIEAINSEIDRKRKLNTEFIEGYKFILETNIKKFRTENILEINNLSRRLKENIKIAQNMGYSKPVINTLESNFVIQEITNKVKSFSELSQSDSMLDQQNLANNVDQTISNITLPKNVNDINYTANRIPLYLFGYELLIQELSILEKYDEDSAIPPRLLAELNHLENRKKDPFIDDLSKMREELLLYQNFYKIISSLKADESFLIDYNLNLISIDLIDISYRNSIIFTFLISLLFSILLIIYLNERSIRKNQN